MAAWCFALAARLTCLTAEAGALSRLWGQEKASCVEGWMHLERNFDHVAYHTGGWFPRNRFTGRDGIYFDWIWLLMHDQVYGQ